MTRDLLARTAPSLLASRRLRALLLGSVAAVACSACAETKPTLNQAAAGPAAAEASRVASTAPMGYPWATGAAGASLPTASAKAPVIR